MKKLKLNIHLIFILCAASLWGASGIFVRSLKTYGVGEMTIVCGRAVFSVIVIGLIILFKDRSLFKVKLRDLWLFAGGGIGSIVLFNFAYFKTMSYTSLSVAAVLMYTSPVFIIIISAFLFGTKITGKKVFALAVAFLGCCFVSGLFEGSRRISGKALLFGFITSFGYALYTIFGELLIRRGYKSLTITFYIFLFAGLGSAPFLMGNTAPATFTPAVLGLIFAMAVLISVLPYLLYTAGLFGVDPTVAPIIATIEPVVATVIGVVIFRETLSFLGVLGIALVLASVVALNIRSKKIILKANAKINLNLDITGKREDGYHFIDTVMQSVSLYDTVRVKKTKKTSLKCSASELSGEDNLGFKAARLFFQKTGITGGAEIYIKKRIPAAAGLGGGSADAAAVLLALDKLYDTVLIKSTLQEMALELGADVPFFLEGGTIRCTGIGEILSPVASLKKGYFVLAKAGEKPSTGEMYKKLDSEPDRKISLEPLHKALEAGDLKGVANGLDNAFLAPWGEIPLMDRLKEFKPLGTGLSGSGPTCFAVFEKKAEAKKALKTLKKENITAFLVKPREKAIIFGET